MLQDGPNIGQTTGTSTATAIAAAAAAAAVTAVALHLLSNRGAPQGYNTQKAYKKPRKYVFRFFEVPIVGRSEPARAA